MGTCLARFVHSIDRPRCTGRTRPQATESSVHVVFPSQKVVYTEVFLAQKKVLHSVLSRRNYGTGAGPAVAFVKNMAAKVDVAAILLL